MRCIGSKIINAQPMTRLEYNRFRGWDLPADENGDDEGFLVEYLDGGKANTAEYAGYVSWSPKDVFERAYRPITGLTLGMAIEALKLGHKVAREGWNGKGMWLEHVPAEHWFVGVDTRRQLADRLPWIGMKTADDKFVPWLASQSDMLADDWRVVE